MILEIELGREKVSDQLRKYQEYFSTGDCAKKVLPFVSGETESWIRLPIQSRSIGNQERIPCQDKSSLLQKYENG